MTRDLQLTIFAVLLASCQIIKPFQYPGSDLEFGPTLDINMLIAQTADSANTLTATYAPSPTITSPPTPSPTYSQTPTSTPTFFFALIESTLPMGVEPVNSSPTPSINLFGQSSKTPTKTPKPIPSTGKPWSCSGVGRYPPPKGEMPAGKPFTATWTVINTGTKTWSVNAVDFIYVSGYRHEGKRIQDLYRTVKPGGTVTWFVDFIAPKAPGVYTSTWITVVGHDRMCGVNFTFEIVGKNK